MFLAFLAFKGYKVYQMDVKSAFLNGNLEEEVIGSLLYVTASKLDIVQAVCMVARFQAAPKKTHVNVVRRIFRY